jgi:hypothetical protein
MSKEKKKDRKLEIILKQDFQKTTIIFKRKRQYSKTTSNQMILILED